MTRSSWSPLYEVASFAAATLACPVYIGMAGVPVHVGPLVGGIVASCVLAELGERRWGRLGRSIALALVAPGLATSVGALWGLSLAERSAELLLIAAGTFAGIGCHGLARAAHAQRRAHSASEAPRSP